MDNVNNNNSIIEQQDNNDVEINNYEYDPIAEKMFDDIISDGYGEDSDLFWEWFKTAINNIDKE